MDSNDHRYNNIGSRWPSEEEETMIESPRNRTIYDSALKRCPLENSSGRLRASHGFFRLPTRIANLKNVKINEVVRMQER